ncbi:MAG TPA: A4/G1 family peptidase [Bryobacteraceae bacterium]|nr:A4/G1 family peptidase [Bryobacteraceae bacterium]
MRTTEFASGLAVTTYPAPLADFDFERATKAEQERYGVPEFPTEKARQHFLRTVKGARIIEPEFKPRERKRSGLPALRRAHGVETSRSWSGGVVYSPSGDQIWFVCGAWNIPTPSLPSGAPSGILYPVSSWVGLDGDNSGDVLQAGCDADITLSSGQQRIQYSPWWEWYPAESFWITNMSVVAGEEFACSIYCISLANGSANPNSALMVVANASRGPVMYFVVTAPPGTVLQGNCAEWIVEALNTGPHGATELAKYTPVKFTDCVAVTVQGKYLYPSDGNTINMTNSSGTVISEGKIYGEVEVVYELS